MGEEKKREEVLGREPVVPDGRIEKKGGCL